MKFISIVINVLKKQISIFHNLVFTVHMHDCLAPTEIEILERKHKFNFSSENFLALKKEQFNYQ